MFNRNATVADAMTRNVETVSPNDTMAKVAEIFATNHFHHLPVVKDDKVVGIVSKTDFNRLEDHFTLFRKQQSASLNEAIMRSMLVSEVMVQQLATVRPTDSLESAVGIFRENLFRAMPVIDSAKKLLGIITPFDIMVFAFRPETMKID